MHLKLIVILLFAGTLIPLVDAQIGVDSASSGSCAQTIVSQAGATRRWRITAEDPGVDCAIAGEVMDFGAGQSLTLRCQESTSGAVPPGAATTLTVRLVSDNTDFGSSTPTAFRVINPTGNSCITEQEITVACTVDGLAGSAPRYGVVRLHIRAERTTVVAYDVDSEDAPLGNLWGIYRCIPGVSALSQSNPQSVYVAGDTIGTSVTANASQYDSANNGNFWATCGAVSFNLGNSFPQSTAKSLTTTVIGSFNTWAQTCDDLSFGYQFTRKSAVSGFTAMDYAFWGGTPPANVAFSDSNRNATLSTTADLSRILTTNGACSYHLNASIPSLSIFNRLHGVRAYCANPVNWINARGANIGNDVPVRGFISMTGAPDTTAYPSVDILTTGSGSTEYTSQSVIAAPVGVYHGSIQTFSTTARTESVLLSTGNSTQTFTLSDRYNFTDIQNRKTLTGANATTFTIGSDLQFQSARGLENVHNTKLSGIAVDCFRSVPGNGDEPTVEMGLTDASGNSPFVQFDVDPPAGIWMTTCTATSAGNTAVFAISYNHTSSFTADTNLVIMPSLKTNSTCNTILNVTVTSEFGFFPNGTEYFAPDDGYWLKIDQVSPNEPTFLNIIFPFAQLTSYHTGRLASAEFCMSEVAGYQPDTKEHPIHIHALANLTGRLFLATVPLQQYENLTGNFSGNFSVLNLTQDGNFTGNFTGNVTLLGASGMIETAFDPWIPVLILGGAAVLFAVARFFFPMVAALISLTAQLFDPPIFGIAGAVMLVGIAIILQIMASAFTTNRE